MSTYLLGEVPFKKVLLHGLVRDANKAKMSKSKGNIVDPLDLSANYGTDALRIGLIFSTAAGNDIPLSEDKIRGMKHFANKLWNMARFITLCHAELDSASRTSIAEIPGQARNDTKELLKLAQNDFDKEMIQKTEALIVSVSKNIDEFRLHEAAQSLYDFTWHEFADKYIEDVKGRIDENSFLILNSLFIILLRLLHPFMPFITEEIYQKMGGEESLMIAPWPQSAYETKRA